MNLINFVVAERATIDYFSIDSIMNVIFKSTETKKESRLFDGVGGFFGKLTMTQYTYEGLGGMTQAQVRDGQKHGMFEVVGFEDDTFCDFLNFSQSYCRITLEQKAALYWSHKIPDCCLVSESTQVLDYAQQLGVPNMSIKEMQEDFFADVELETTQDCSPSLSLAGPFDPRVDADKVEAAFSNGLEGDLAVLKQKSYWVVVCVLFEWFGWLRLRKRAAFCKWVNDHFHFEHPLVAEIDLKSAINKINVKERNLDLWPNNQYRDLAYVIRKMFFGERQGLHNGYYVYANEPNYLKSGTLWRRKDL